MSIRKIVERLDSYWHAYVCQLVARYEASDPGNRPCPTCDGTGVIEEEIR